MHIRIPARLLSRVLRTVLPFASKDDTRPALHGVRFELAEGGRLVVIATDGHRLAAWTLNDRDLEVVSAKQQTAITVPVREVVAMITALRPYARASRRRGRGEEDSYRAEIRTVARRVSVYHRALAEPVAETLIRDSGFAFPDVRKLLPSATAANIAAPPLNAAYAADACRAFSIAAPSWQPVAVRAFATPDDHSTPGLGPVVFHAAEVPELLVVVMPIRAEVPAKWRDLPPAIAAPPAVTPIKSAAKTKAA